VAAASRPTNRCRARASAAGTPTTSPLTIATSAISRLVRKPSTKFFWSRMLANQRRLYPSGGKDATSFRKNASHDTNTSGATITAYPATTTVPNAARPIQRRAARGGPVIKRAGSCGNARPA